MAEISPLRAPSEKTLVHDGSQLTSNELDLVRSRVNATNFAGVLETDLPAGTIIEVAPDGSVTAIYPDGSRSSLTPGDTILILPSAKVPVADLNHLTPTEKAQVVENIRRVNPYLPAGVLILVDDTGAAVVHYPGGSTVSISADELVYQGNHPSTSMSGSQSSSINSSNNLNSQSTYSTNGMSRSAQKSQLPNTGTNQGLTASLFGLLSGITGLGLITKGKNQEEDDKDSL